MSDQHVRMIVLSTDNFELITFYTETLDFKLKFRDGAHYAALDGGSVTLALATAIDHPIPGQVVVGIKTDDVDGAAKAIEENGGGIVRAPTTTLTSAAPWCTTTRATPWSSTSRFSADVHPSGGG